MVAHTSNTEAEVIVQVRGQPGKQTLSQNNNTINTGGKTDNKMLSKIMLATKLVKITPSLP